MSALARLALAAAALLALAGGAQAQGDQFPQRTVRLIVPFPPGGSGDFVGRLLADKLGGLWQRPVVVENRPGASTLLGLGMVAKSAPDGYTIGLNTAGFAVQPAIRRSMPFDALEDFDFVTQIMETPFVLTAHPALGVNSAKELLDWAKANPGKLNFASFGVGSTPHILGEILALNAGAKMVHVPFKGSSESIAAHLGGEIQVNFDVPQQVMGHIRQGRLRPLLITASRRYRELPEVPTGPELGMPDLDLPTWFGIVAPRKLPPEVLRRLNEGFLQALKMPDVVAALDKQAMAVVGSSPAEFRASVARSMQRVKNAVAAAGIPQAD
jgi:tripartite-type tricarboxylate transporter receptor subunit TctC